MTDTTRYKSIIVRVDTHAKLKELAGRDKKISGVVSQLVEKEYNNRISKHVGDENSHHLWVAPENRDRFEQLRDRRQKILDKYQ